MEAFGASAEKTVGTGKGKHPKVIDRQLMKPRLNKLRDLKRNLHNSVTHGNPLFRGMHTRARARVRPALHGPEVECPFLPGRAASQADTNKSIQRGLCAAYGTTVGLIVADAV